MLGICVRVMIQGFKFPLNIFMEEGKFKRVRDAFDKIRLYIYWAFEQI